MQTARVLIPFSAFLLITTAVAIVGYVQVSRQLSALEREQLTMRTTLTQLASDFDTYKTADEAATVTLSDRIYDNAKTLSSLTDSVEGFDSEVGELTGSVKHLEKLTTTDPELLQKYSKIYFLNEHYKPGDLSIIEEAFDLVNGKEVSVHSDVLPFLHDLLHAAQRDGIDLMVLSGYRSYEEQTTLKGSYSVRYGSGANQFSADQGYSEHQLGTTVDFTTKQQGENLEAFKTGAAYTWLLDNAYRYGFVLSYPEGNSYYMFEPWHWRFVGKDLASYLHKKDVHFYDLEQREIDGYLASLFDE